MDTAQGYVLVTALALPLLAAGALLFVPGSQKMVARYFSAVIGAILLGLSVYVFLAYQAGGEVLQMQLRWPWIENVGFLGENGIQLKVGVDGIAAPMVLLTGIVILSGTWVSWKIENRLKESIFIREAVLMWAEIGTQHLGRYAPHASDDALQRFFSVAHDIALYQSQGDPCGGLRSTAIPASMGLRMMLALSDVVTSSDQARPSAGVVRRVANDTPPVAVPACGGNAAVLVALKELPAEQRMMVLRNGFGAPRTMVAGGSGTGHATGVLQ